MSAPYPNIGLSTLAMIAAAILAVTIHETFHLITALSLPHTGSITLTPTSIQTVMPPGWPENTVVLAGPLGSLMLGALLVTAGRLWGVGWWRLVIMWLGLISLQNFFGYLMTSLFLSSGDIARFLINLGTPTWAKIGVTILGTIGMFLVAYLYAREVVRYTGLPDKTDRSRQTAASKFGFLPWVYGTLVLVAIYGSSLLLLKLPIGDAVGSMAGIVTIAIFAPIFAFWYSNKKVWVNHPVETGPLVTNNSQARGLVALTATLVLAIVIISLIGGIRI